MNGALVLWCLGLWLSYLPLLLLLLVNEGEFGPFIVEYDGSYRMLRLFSSPFQLGFYNTTLNAYTLALRMGLTRSESLFRWVWEANRGNPVRENATLTLGEDGNLVLANPHGHIAWQTNTANKGEVGLKILPTGNMVLHDSKSNFVWQSFNYATDTLLVGQHLRVGGRLLSRISPEESANGPYSLVIEPKRLAVYYATPNLPKPYLYFAYNFFIQPNTRLQNVTLHYEPVNDGNAFALELQLSTGGFEGFSRPKYNGTLTFLWLERDGNVRFYTYNREVDWGAWDVSFSLFSRNTIAKVVPASSARFASECQLPERCGNFGLCETSQCVACPLPTGIMGWSKNCEPVSPPPCGSKNFYYYKIEGVDHFGRRYTNGEKMTEGECGNKCSSNCKCLGYFYPKEKSRCWIAYDLKTLTRVAQSTHVGYIKAIKSLQKNLEDYIVVLCNIMVAEYLAFSLLNKEVVVN